MKRKAVIIGCFGGYRGLDLLKGASIDLINYQTFLQSSVGGEWDKDEIIILEETDSVNLKSIISGIEADYSFVVFTGHGFINSFSKEDSICLRDKDVSITSLVTSSKRQTIFIDACRENFPNDKVEILSESVRLFSKYAGRNTRDLFNDALARTPEGIILVYSCSPNESSGGDSLIGSYFSYSIINAAKKLVVSSASNEVIPLNIVFEESKTILKKYITTQNPEMAGQIRRLTFPPFAIG